MLLSVIIPCYNEELVIEETYKRLTSVLGSMQHSYELIFIVLADEFIQLSD